MTNTIDMKAEYKRRRLELADIIDNTPASESRYSPGFNMRDWMHRGEACGTPSCIAGWAAWMAADKPKYLDTSDLGILNQAKAFLGLTRAEDNNLFTPYVLAKGDMSAITPHQAAATLRTFAETGVIDWTLVGLTVVGDGR